MSTNARRCIVTYNCGRERGHIVAWTHEAGEQAAKDAARLELRRARMPHVADLGDLQVAEVLELNPARSKKGKKPKLDDDEREVMAMLEAAITDEPNRSEDRQTRHFMESDGDEYDAARRLVKRGYARLVDKGETAPVGREELRPEKWIVVTATEKGLRAFEQNPAKRVPLRPNQIVVFTQRKGGPVEEYPVTVEEFVGVLAIHPSLRNIHEIELGRRKKPQSWGITHVPSGQLVATVRSLQWARRLAREILAFSDEGITSTDPRTAALAVGGPGLFRVRYIVHVSRQASEPSKKRGEFPTFAAWKKTAGELGPEKNPRTYSFVRPHESPTLILGAVGSGQVWKYRGAEIRVGPRPPNAATVIGLPTLKGMYVGMVPLSAPDPQSVLRAAKLLVDIHHAGHTEPELVDVIGAIQRLVTDRMSARGQVIDRRTVARAIEMHGGDFASDRLWQWFDGQPLARRLEIVDFAVEYLALIGAIPWPSTNPARASNPEDLAASAAVAAAVGSLIGAFIGAAAGAVLFGAVGAAIGAASVAQGGAATGLVVGAVFGVPVGAVVGTIWGAVRQTGRALAGHQRGGAMALAGIGAAVAGPLAPLGAAVGAYLGAPKT